MKKEIVTTLLQHFLSRSTHRHLQRVSKIAFSFENKAPQLFSDEKYLNHSLSKINCDFLINPQLKQFTVLPSAFLKMNAIVSNPGLLRPMHENNETSQIVTKMISTIKKLSQNENLRQVFGQIKELIIEMDEKQANQCRKYLLYINKWILSHKQHSKIITQQEEQQLRKILVQKICAGYFESHSHPEIAAELVRQQTLLKARQNILQGDSEKAKLNYEIVFENLQNSEAIRMEALQYLCRSSQETGDATYLLAMMTKIKQQKGQSKHMDCIRQALRELTLEYIKSSPELTQ